MEKEAWYRTFVGPVYHISFYLPKLGLPNFLGEGSQKSKKATVDCRRSTAAQFFAEEAIQETVTADEVVQLLNEASVPKDEHTTLKKLQLVQELILNKDIKLLDNFLDEVVNFQHHPSNDVRKFVVQFIESACKKEPKTLPKVVSNLDMMLEDPSVMVQKKVMLATTQLYMVAIRWLCSAKKVDEIMVATWASITQLKGKILKLVDSDNEGVRAMAVKFMECVVLAQSFKDQISEYKSGELSLDDVPVILNIFRPRKLEEEAKEIFQKIVDFHSASHVSSCNLMACMQVLTTIGKKRFQFFPKVLLAFESLHANLPPTLSQSQVSSVRKNLKVQLFTLAKHPGAAEFHSQISILLSDLGATPAQIMKCIPLASTAKKRPDPKPDKNWTKQSKGDTVTSSKPAAITKTSAIDATVEDLVPKFNHINVADLVLVNMLNLPDDMPAHFQSTYTPIAAAGTDPQVRHIARLLATQLVLAGLGKVVDIKEEPDNVSDEEDEPTTKQIQTVIGCSTDHLPKKQGVVLIPSGSSQLKTSRVSKNIDFQFKVKPLSAKEADRFCRSAYGRILDAEKVVTKKGAGGMRTKILTTLATQFGGDMAVDLKQHILDNPRNHLDLAFHWLYQQYASYKGYEGSAEVVRGDYEETVNALLAGILEGDEQNNVLFNRFFLDLPHITEGMADCLKALAAIEDITGQALDIAKSMTLRRPPQKLLFLSVICDLTLHENTEVRSKAVDAAVEIYESGRLRSFIETFALRSLKFLLDPVPKNSGLMLFKELPEAWTDDLIKVCLHLYFALLPFSHNLICDLGAVYVETTADVKRTILRALELPVKNMSMASPELLHFVETCPQGAETFVTRIIHILTDKAPPSAELVARVRDLYQKRVQDVRFLIPIINGLKKKEVIAALPELIKLNPTVVKEVFHRLVGSNLSSPLSPAELLIALHNINTSQCNLKIIIKATSLCFEEKNVYTQVVLAMVLQQLMEQNPLPILLMRTVIQSLANHPHLLGFVTNILQRLIVKEVWKQPKIWEGFIKCCQRTKPQSFQVLLQLPPVQLEEVMKAYPDLRDPLLQHVENFTDHQRAHIPKTILDVLDVFQPKVESFEVEDVEMNEPPPPGEEN